jgi:hypothetical protein
MPLLRLTVSTETEVLLPSKSSSGRAAALLAYLQELADKGVSVTGASSWWVKDDGDGDDE